MDKGVDVYGFTSLEPPPPDPASVLGLTSSSVQEVVNIAIQETMARIVNNFFIIELGLGFIIKIKRLTFATKVSWLS